MKTTIKSAEFIKEYETKFGVLYQHKVKYDDKTAYYSSKKKEQTEFIAGQECEFVEEKRTGQNGEYWIIKPMPKLNSPYAKAVKKEQSRYSGFAMSYAKDLLIADKITFDQLLPSAEKMFHFMVQLDKTLES